MSANVIDSFLISLGFKTDTQGAEEYKRALGGVEKAMKVVGAAAVVAAGAIGAMVIRTAKVLDDIGDLASQVNMTAREVDALNRIAANNDSSMDAMAQTLTQVAARAGQAALGIGRYTMIFQRLGISVKDGEGKVKSAGVMLEDLADKMSMMDSGARLGFAEKLGIDRTLVPLLSEGGEAFRKLKVEALDTILLTEEQYAAADRITKQWIRIKQEAADFMHFVAASLFPIFEEGMVAIRKFIERSRGSIGAVSRALKIFVGIVSTLLGWFFELIGIVLWLIGEILKLDAVVFALKLTVLALVGIGLNMFFLRVAAAAQIAITVFRGMLVVLTLLRSRAILAAIAMTMMNAAAMLIPVLIGLAIAAVVLLIEDFITMLRGGESYFGDLINKFPILKTLFLEARDVLMRLWAAIVSAYNAAGEFAVNVIDKFKLIMKRLGEIFAIVVKWVREKFNAISDSIKSAFMGAFDFIGDHIKKFVDKFKKALSFIAELFGIGGKDVDVNVNVGGVKNPGAAGGGINLNRSATMIPSAFAAPPVRSQGPLGAAAGVARPAASSVTYSNTVTVPSVTVVSPDPARAGESVRDELARVSRASTRNWQPAVVN